MPNKKVPYWWVQQLRAGLPISYERIRWWITNIYPTESYRYIELLSHLFIATSTQFNSSGPTQQVTIVVLTINDDDQSLVFASHEVNKFICFTLKANGNGVFHCSRTTAYNFVICKGIWNCRYAFFVQYYRYNLTTICPDLGFTTRRWVLSHGRYEITYIVTTQMRRMSFLQME